MNTEEFKKFMNILDEEFRDLIGRFPDASHITKDVAITTYEAAKSLAAVRQLKEMFRSVK